MAGDVSHFPNSTRQMPGDAAGCKVYGLRGLELLREGEKGEGVGQVRVDDLSSRC